MADEYELKAHQAMDHKTEWYTVGGYKPVQENREPIKPASEESSLKKMKLDLADMEEDALEPEEEGL